MTCVFDTAFIYGLSQYTIEGRTITSKSTDVMKAKKRNLKHVQKNYPTPHHAQIVVLVIKSKGIDEARIASGAISVASYNPKMKKK
jgi:hypothetical protein